MLRFAKDLFQSALGTVNEETLMQALKLMLYGLVGIFIVMVLIYAVGECWEFCVSLFGIKRKKVSWFAVLFIGAGGFIGTLLGTLIFPILGSLIGGMMGAFVTAFAYELLHTGLSKNAWELAWAAAKMRFMAIIGKLVAGIALAALLVKQVVFL